MGAVAVVLAVSAARRQREDVLFAQGPPRCSLGRAGRSTEEVVALIDAHRGRRSGGLRWVEPISSGYGDRPLHLLLGQGPPPSHLRDGGSLLREALDHRADDDVL